MAKKKPKAAANDPVEKARVELRFDAVLNDQIRELAERASISVNQLIQGVMRWAVQNAVVGEPYREENGYVDARLVPGCLFFGQTVSRWEPGEREEWEEHLGEKLPKAYKDKGSILFSLDFTERHVVRDVGAGDRTATEKRGRRGPGGLGA